MAKRFKFRLRRDVIPTARASAWKLLNIPLNFGAFLAFTEASKGKSRLVVAFSPKLQTVKVAFGRNARQEICARFLGSNSATRCNLDGFSKWVQGRSLRRACSIYAAAVIGSAFT
jgi:hypothetical protein